MRNTVYQEDMALIEDVGCDWNRFANKSFLITGANGFLPAYIIDFLMYLNQKKLANKQCKIIALIQNLEHAQERFCTYLGNKQFVLHHQDVSNQIKLDMKLDFIIHAASLASPKYYATDPIAVSLPNILGTNNVLALAIVNKIESLLFFSSAEVYGKVQETLITENDYGYLDPLELRSCYAESKRMGESLCVSYFHQHKVPVKIVRPFHTYGPGMKLDDGRVFADFVRNIIETKNIVLKSDGQAERAFCYLADAVGGFLTVLLNGQNAQAYNLANPHAKCSIKELAELLVALFPDKKLSVEYDLLRNNNYLESPVVDQIPDITKIRQLGWEPTTTIEDGFKKTIRSYSGHH